MLELSAKKSIFIVLSILGAAAIGYICFASYFFYSLHTGCGMKDGPLRAQLINERPPAGAMKSYDLDGGKLVVVNRSGSLPPILELIEDEKVKWTLEMDVSKNKGYELCRLWEISNVSILNRTDPIQFSFLGHWTYGNEHGTMEIDRGDGDNSFCLRW